MMTAASPQIVRSNTIIPQPPVSLEVTSNWATDFSAGENFSCAYNSWQIACAGANNKNQLLRPNPPVSVQVADQQVTAIPGFGPTVARIESGSDFSCMKYFNSDLSCWGSNEDGRLGNAGFTMRTAETAVTPGPFPQPVNKFSLGDGFACAVLRDVSSTKPVYCWGRNDSGQFGTGTTNGATMPTQGAKRNNSGDVLEDIFSISAGKKHLCALDTNRQIYCWGENEDGQLGLGHVANQVYATQVLGLSPARVVTAGANHTCAVTDTNQVECWGSNEYQQLGHLNRDYGREVYPIVQPH